MFTGRCQSNGNITVAKTSKSETTPVLLPTADEIFVQQLLIHINKLSEADKINIRRDIINLAINYNCNSDHK